MADNEDLSVWPGVLEPEYCPHCGLPLAFCEFGPKFQLCLKTLQACRPQILAQYYAEVDLAQSLLRSAKISGDTSSSSSSSAAVDDSKESEADQPQAIQPGKRFAKVTKGGAKKVVIEVSDRGRKKRLTTIMGLQHFTDEKLKDVAKGMSKKFACSVTVTKSAAGDDQIQTQGDVGWDAMEYLQEKFGIKEKSIDVKRV